MTNPTIRRLAPGNETLLGMLAHDDQPVFLTRELTR